MATAESRVRIQHDGAALAATGVKMRTAARKSSEVDLGFHFDPVLSGFLRGGGAPPRVFSAKSPEALETKVIALRRGVKKCGTI